MHSDATLKPRSGGWIDTAAGPFHPADPRPEDIDITVIAGALANICRFGGHVSSFYSVAQHSVLCARQAPDELKLEALLHDAAEAYIGDMVTPLKREMITYRAREALIDGVIRERFRLPFPRSPIIKLIDEQMMVTEAALIHTGTSGWWRRDGQPRPFDITIDPWQPQRAGFEFLDFYRRLASIPLPAAA